MYVLIFTVENGGSANLVNAIGFSLGHWMNHDPHLVSNPCFSVLIVPAPALETHCALLLSVLLMLFMFAPIFPYPMA